MKSPSKYENEDKIKALHSQQLKYVNDELDHAVSNIPDNILADIARVRATALNQSNGQVTSKASIIDKCISWLFNPLIKIGVPVAVAVMIAVSVRYVSVDTIPELPLAMMATDVPNEDFAMLEDLEFVTWLAENEQSTLL